MFHPYCRTHPFHNPHPLLSHLYCTIYLDKWQTYIVIHLVHWHTFVH